MPTQPSKQLDVVPNPHPGRDYEVNLEIPEFTCLCPVTGQPDFATIRITYVPDQHLVELKSIKLYVWSYRNEGAFHEDVTNRILEDFVTVAAPRFIEVIGDFNVRGGIKTVVRATPRQAARDLESKGVDIRPRAAAFVPAVPSPCPSAPRSSGGEGNRNYLVAYHLSGGLSSLPAPRLPATHVLEGKMKPFAGINRASVLTISYFGVRLIKVVERIGSRFLVSYLSVLALLLGIASGGQAPSCGETVSGLCHPDLGPHLCHRTRPIAWRWSDPRLCRTPNCRV